MRHLYPNFLHDPKVWKLNEAYYRRLVKSVTKMEPQPFFQTKYANGRPIQDDHIFSTKINERILQVIQREPSSEQPFISAFVKKWDGSTDMLVLSLELTTEMKPVLEKIVSTWLVEACPPDEVRRYVRGVAAAN